VCRRGAALGLAGAVKGLGISSLKAYGIMDRLKAGVEEKGDANTREGEWVAGGSVLKGEGVGWGAWHLGVAEGCMWMLWKRECAKQLR
jgi:hypothetical protein